MRTLLARAGVGAIGVPTCARLYGRVGGVVGGGADGSGDGLEWAMSRPEGPTVRLNRCQQCEVDLIGQQGYVRSGVLLCGGCGKRYGSGRRVVSRDRRHEPRPTASGTS